MADRKATLKAQTKRIVEARSKEIAAFTLSLNKVLRRNLNTILKEARGGKLQSREAARLLGSIMTRLQELGLGHDIAELDQIYLSEIEALKLDFESSAGRPLVISTADIDDVETLILFDEQRVMSTITSYVDDTKASLMQQIIGGNQFDLDEILDTATDKIGSNIETELNTAVMGYNRALQFKKAKEYDLDLFLYIGPDDDITRPFCQSVLDGEPEGVEPRSAPIYTADEIEQMYNEQGLPVASFGGGYNCRHQWRPISQEYAKELGYGDDD